MASTAIWWTSLRLMLSPHKYSPSSLPQKQTGLRKEARLTAQRYSVSNGLRAYHQLLADAMALSAPTPA